MRNRRGKAGRNYGINGITKDRGKLDGINKINGIGGRERL